MVVGILQVQLSMDWAESLKDKRRVVSSLKDRLHREHMVSVAEVDTQDDPRTATLGIVLATSSSRQAQSVLDRVMDKINDHRDCVVSDSTREILTGR
jgi:uncharacterized protein YlxP (DUF503 family)